MLNPADEPRSFLPQTKAEKEAVRAIVEGTVGKAIESDTTKLRQPHANRTICDSEATSVAYHAGGTAGGSHLFSSREKA